MNKTDFLSIDPGLSGSFILWAGGKPIESIQWGSEHDILAELEDCYTGVHPERGNMPAIIESVTSVAGQNPRNQAKLMQNYGWYRGVCQVIGYQVVEVAPVVWQKAWRQPGLTYSQRKSLWLKCAKNHFKHLERSDMRVNSFTADALLIGQWWKQKPED